MGGPLKLFCILFAVCVSAFAGDTPRIAARPIPLGPVVDVTLRSGESSKGELLSFADGTLKLKLENGAIVTQDGAEVLSVRFVAEKPATAPPPLSAAETELTLAEQDLLIMYRSRELGRRGPLANKNLPKPPPLTPREAAEFDRLRAKADLHINALEAEIPLVTTEEMAQAKLSDLGRYYFLYGQYIPQEIRAFLKRAADSIRNPAVKAKFNDLGFNTFWTGFIEKHGKKMHERAIERNMLEKMDKQTPPAPGEKTN